MELQIFFQANPEDITFGETLEVTSLSKNIFRLEHSPLWSEEAHYGDVVELAPQDGDSWRFVRVVEPSAWHHFNRIVSKRLVESELFQLWLESILERGGFWEVAFGGVVFISYPPDSSIDAEAELQELISRAP